MAGTIIDALVVTLGLDSSGFKKGQQETKEGLKKTRDESEQTAKDMEAAGKRAASFFGSIRTELLALVGVTLSAQGIKSFITSMTGNLQQLGISAGALDMSAKSLDGWQRAAEAAGSSAEKITGTLGNFQNVLTQIRTGGGQDNPLYAALSSFAGATGANFDYQNDNAEAIMRKIAANWSKLSKDAQRRFGGMFGFDNAQQQGLSNGHLVQDADRFTKTSRATQDATDKAQAFNRRLVEMQQNFSAASQVLYTALIPYIEKLIPVIEKVGIWISTHGPEINKFFSDSADEVKKVVDSVGGWHNALELLAVFVAGSWALRMLSGIAKVRRGFGPLLVAMAAVSSWDKIGKTQEEAKKSGKSTGQYLVDRMNSNTGSKDGILGKADAWLKKSYAWWAGISGTNGATNKYDAYGTREPSAPQAKGQGKILLDWMSPMFSKLESLYKLPAGLLKSVATTESGGNQFAVSGAGAKGLFQFMDGTAKDFGLKGNDVFDPEKSANAAAKYFSQLLKSNGGDLVKAIASYNWGIGNVQKKGLGNAPLETQNYVPKVLAGIQVGASSAASRNAPVAMNQSSGNKTDIHIGEMHMQTSASNANALGEDMNRNIRRNSLVTPMMSGQG